jgi:predicted GNAT family acetyltransferase
MWSDITADYVRQHFQVEGTFCVGIKKEGKLASFGYAVITPKVSHITWIATHPKYRNRGYATTIVSALLKQCLSQASTAIIYVMDKNPKAKDIYTKVGFKPYKQYIFQKT